MVVALALLSAALFGTGVALMQRPAAAVPAEFAARPGLLVRVIRQPIWLLGVGAEIAGFVFQVIALRHGSLVVVQPLLTTSLLFTIALVGVWTRQGVTAAEWAALVAVVAGLALFMLVASPSDRSSGSADPADLDHHRPVDRKSPSPCWSGTDFAPPVAAGRRPRPGRRTERRLHGRHDQGLRPCHRPRASLSALTSWAPYVLCAAGLTAMLLTQTAYQAGLPKVSLPIITVTDPLVSCGIGVALFDETLKFTEARAPFVLMAIGIIATGLIVLSRSDVAAEAPEPAVSR